MKNNEPSPAGKAVCTTPQSPETARLACRILVVDDDKYVRRFSTQALMGSGYHVDAAGDGAAAWEALQIKDYHLLITDNEMPKLTGVELVRKLRSTRMALPVIMATGRLPTEALAHNPSLQLAALLPKPFSVGELLETVRTVLRVADSPCEPVEPPSGPSIVALRT